MKTTYWSLLATTLMACGGAQQVSPPAGAPAATPIAAEAPTATPAAAPVVTSAGALDTDVSRASTTVDRLGAKDFAGAREYFDPTMRDLLSAEKLSSVWTQTEAAAGPYKGKSFAGKKVIGGHTAFDYDLEFAHGRFVVHVLFDNGSVAGLFIQPKS